MVSETLVALGLLIGGLGEPTCTLTMHPLHTTLTEVSVDAGAAIEIRMRAFIDDFSAAVAGRRDASPPHSAPDGSVERYLSTRLMLTGPGGRAVTLRVTSVRHEGDVVWVTLRAAGVRTLAGVRLTNRVLFERYDDQVNIVQTRDGPRRRTLLFTSRDGATPKPLV